jgi:membrane-bound ClpP family serine protease
MAEDERGGFLGLGCGPFNWIWVIIIILVIILIFPGIFIREGEGYYKE